ncbi:hypothetical protein ACIRPP_31675 [Streptomyces sp. NPDC101219]|uniref:hypothetical protein n=1 Tax=Streptomyces sp. NPDC101219 TaxID=3366131 RepID=UPI00380ADDA1
MAAGRRRTRPPPSASARAVGLFLPEPAGTPDGSAVRVPVEDGSLTDLIVVLGPGGARGGINAAHRGPHAGADPISSPCSSRYRGR